MSGPKNMNARERARLAAEQAAARKRDQRILIAVVAAFVLLVVAAGIGLQAWRTNRSPSAVPSTSASASPVPITSGQPIVLGSLEAPTTITLYEDFHCPHCADFEEQFGPVITQAHESGAARVEFYPMAFIDKGSAAAANAMACAAEAGFGQAFYLGLFANHTLHWSDAQLIDLAAKVSGAPPSEAFKTCVTSTAHGDWVSSINAVAEKNGVAQTPTMLINGKSVDIENLTLDTLKAMITNATHR
ncbi:MAG TPA: thioredoxin domain-containing protein [Propionibacteriaceae bacterium]